ncbi:unnamed protein product [Lymnaea stagnalis]|uniref:C1q domain-containing protein n=1 Tax=Lymnaea stagnalis TaxID=6523 RepID=A0AAV2H6G8_LYMST
MTATKNQVSLVALKLQVLEDERKQLHEALDAYVNEVISLGNTFVSTEASTGANFKDVSQAIERALMCVMEKKLDYRPAQSTPPTPDVTVPPLSPSVAPLTEQMTSQRSSIFASDKVLTSVKDYMDILETHVRSNASKTDVLSAMMPQILEEINALKTQMEGMEPFKERLEHVDRRVESIEKDDSVAVIKSQLSAIEEQTLEIDARLETLRGEFYDNKAENADKIQKVEHRIEDLDSREVKTVASVADLESKLSANTGNIGIIGTQLEDKAREVDKIEERLQKSEKELVNIKRLSEDRYEKDSATLAEMENRLRRQEEKWTDREMKNIRKIEDKLQRLDAERKKDMYFMGENVDKILTKLDGVKTNENTLATKIDTLEKRQKRPLGFTAKLSISFTSPMKRSVLRDFTDIVTNRGDHFQPQTGEFTAPVEGLYLVSLTHRQWQDGEIWLVVLLSPNPGPGGGKEKVVCETRTDVSRTSSTSASIVWMNAGDKIWVNVRNVKGTDTWIDAPSSFSCFLVA